ncbi:metallopeptidase TldD-related protein [Nannocystaceae bacterium ST9]
MIGKRIGTRREFTSLGLIALAGVLLPGSALAGQPEPAPPAPPSEVEAMIDELKRGILELRLPDADPPYAASLTAVRIDSLVLDGSYGGISIDLLSREAGASVGVYVGSRERDNTNFYGGNLEPGFALPAEPDLMATRKRLWLAMDQSYRAASAAYKAKLNAIDRLADKNLPADHGPWPASVVKLGWSSPTTQIRDVDMQAPEFDRAGLRSLIAELSGRFGQHPKIDNGDVIVHLQRGHSLDIACDREQSDGPVELRRVLGGSQDRAVFGVMADVQAEDGMQLDHGLCLEFQTLPSAAELREQALALTDQVLRELEELLAAPMIDEDYDGPLLLSPLAAAQLLAATIPAQASGDPPPLSDYGRLVELEPHWQDELGKAVMPEFIDIVDDPLAAGAGHYELDAEGVPAQRIELVRAGVLHTLLMANRPNDKITVSNGHARGSGSDAGPSISNLTLSSRKKGLSQAALEKDLLARAREDGYEFAYVIETLRDGRVLGPAPRDGASMYTSGRKVSLPLPGRVFKIDGKGTRTLVRGAMLAPMSMRALRRIRAVGDKPRTTAMGLSPGLFGGFTDIGLHGMLSQTVPTQITTPALLIDGLELVLERGEKERLPILDHPLRRAKG